MMANFKSAEATEPPSLMSLIVTVQAGCSRRRTGEPSKEPFDDGKALQGSGYGRCLQSTLGIGIWSLFAVHINLLQVGLGKHSGVVAYKTKTFRIDGNRTPASQVSPA